MPEPYASEDVDQLVLEHRALMCVYGSAQARCTQEAASQALAVRRMQAQLMRLRAQVIVRDSQLAWEREDRKALEALVPGLPSRAALSRQVVALLNRVQDLLHERLRSRLLEPRATVSTTTSALASVAAVEPAECVDPQMLESSLHAADLVICQTGCVSHGEYWRVEDHCKRTGKLCVMVAQPEAIRIVRIQSPSSGPSALELHD